MKYRCPHCEGERDLVLALAHARTEHADCQACDLEVLFLEFALEHPHLVKFEPLSDGRWAMQSALDL